MLATMRPSMRTVVPHGSPEPAQALATLRERQRTRISAVRECGGCVTRSAQLNDGSAAEHGERFESDPGVALDRVEVKIEVQPDAVGDPLGEPRVAIHRYESADGRIWRGDPDETSTETVTCVPGRLLSTWTRRLDPAPMETVGLSVADGYGICPNVVTDPEHVSATSSQIPLQVRSVAKTVVLLPFETVTARFVPTIVVVPKFTRLK